MSQIVFCFLKQFLEVSISCHPRYLCFSMISRKATRADMTFLHNITFNSLINAQREKKKGLHLVIEKAKNLDRDRYIQAVQGRPC